ncbi:hypothetical protein [Pseudomonas sp. SJZ079]|uniref:hypothetical protein n=1 Tax=Pseudomonas sp. SJZ079 TaxID=2572887 RepID=UPI0011BE3AB7
MQCAAASIKRSPWLFQELLRNRPCRVHTSGFGGLGDARFRQAFADYQSLRQAQLFVEVERLAQGAELRDTVLRNDNAFNYPALKGMLDADKTRPLAEVRQASERPQQASLRCGL